MEQSDNIDDTAVTNIGMEKQIVKRMKIKLQPARDFPTLLPMTDPIFRVKICVPKTGKRIRKTPQDLSQALKSLLGFRSNMSMIE